MSRYAYEYAEWLSLQLGGSLSAVFVNTTYAEITVSEKMRQEMIHKENEGYRERLQQFTANYPDRDEEPAHGGKTRTTTIVTGRIAPRYRQPPLKFKPTHRCRHTRQA